MLIAISNGLQTGPSPPAARPLPFYPSLIILPAQAIYFEVINK